jgi:hypothetical protein
MRGKTVEIEELPAYAAVALAGLGWLPDTIMSRAVIIRMRRRAADEQVEAFRRRLHLPEGERLREQIESWASLQPEEINWKQLELPLGVEDRAADVWESLLAVADLAGGEWPQKARKAAVALVAAGKDMEPSLGIRLLADIRTVFGETEHMSTKTLISGLIEIEDAPWGDLRGKPLDDRSLANRLRQYGLKSKNVRVGGGVVKGYARSDFADTWSRYAPSPADKSATSATIATSEQNRAENVADAVACSATSGRHTEVSAADAVADEVAAIADDVADEEFKKPNKNGHCSAVADVADFPGYGGREPITDWLAARVADGTPINGHPCLQCYLDDGQTKLQVIGGQEIWLHDQCCPFYVENERWHGRDPEAANNAPALGPPGDSLDDFDLPAFLPRRGGAA